MRMNRSGRKPRDSGRKPRPKSGKEPTLIRRKVKGPNRSFNPDDVSTELSQAISRDLTVPLHEYGAVGPGTQFAMSRQCEEFLKKFQASTTDHDLLEANAFAKYRKVNAYMERINQGINFPLGCQYIQRSMSFMDKVHLRARALAHDVMGGFSEDEWFLFCKHSSGSSIGVPYSDTSLEAKSKYPMTTTLRAKPMMERYLNFDTSLCEAMDSLNPSGLIPRYRTVEGSRATTVEKDSRSRRFICVEPTANMFLQQGLMHMLYKRMARVGLTVNSLPDQHRKKACVASITGQSATIDWTSASDSVGIELLRWLIPPKWFEVLDIVRSPATLLEGQWEELHMFSSMGNAATFPLETIVFWTYAHAVRLTLDIHTNSLFPEWEDLGEVSVFGDDCIVPSSMAQPFMTVLELIGFEVNFEKSFFGNERFRESCGGDFLAGYPVRPFSLKAPSNSKMSSLEPWLYIILNSLIKKYIVYFGSLKYVYGRDAFAAISLLFREHNLKLKVVPPEFPDDAGLKSNDFQRLAFVYGFELNPIYFDKHGTVSFNYCHFQYKEVVRKNDFIRLADWLKKPAALDLSGIFRAVDVRNTPWLKIRRNGGYVVGRSYCDRWSQIQGNLDAQYLSFAPRKYKS